jgi:hypothetical protein
MTPYRHLRALLAILLSIVLFTDLVEAESRFDKCLEKVKAIKNGTINSTIGFDWEYHGPIRGFDPTAGFPRPITLTYDGKILRTHQVSYLNQVLIKIRLQNTLRWQCSRSK